MKHKRHVNKILRQLTKHGFNPCSDTTPKSIFTRVEVAKEIYIDMINANEIGERK